eukprot:SAG25_NODE_500_length_7380_cov_16.363137_3_plen_179_part_00
MANPWLAPPRAAPNALPAGLPSSQRNAPQRLPIGSCPTYGGQAAVQPRSDPQASPSATCQEAARKGRWKSASSSHLTLRRNGASSGHAGRWRRRQLLWLWLRGGVVDYCSQREVPCERRLGGRCGGCLPPLRGPLVGRHLGRGYLGLPGLIVTNTSVVPQQQRHRPREALLPGCLLAG